MLEGAPVNVKDFGAVGDGVTDDTVAIQDAVNQSRGKILFFPKGNYLISDAVQLSRQSIVGETSTTHAPFVGTKFTLSTASAGITVGAESTIEHIMVDGDGVVGTKGITLLSNNHYNMLSDVQVTGCEYGLYISDSAWSQNIENSFFTSNKTNIYVGASSAIYFRGCEANNCTGAAGFHNIHVYKGQVTWTGGALQNPGALSYNMYNHDGTFVCYGIYVEGQTSNFSFYTFGDTQRAYTNIDSPVSFQSSDDGVAAIGNFAVVDVSNMKMIGSGSTNNHAFYSAGGIITMRNVEFFSTLSADSAYIELALTGINPNRPPITSSSARLIKSATPSEINSNSTLAQATTPTIDAAVFHTQGGGSFSVVGAGNTPNITIDLIGLLGTQKLTGMIGQQIVVVLVARYGDNSTANSYTSLSLDGDISGNSGSASDTGTYVPVNTWGYFSMGASLLVDAPTTLNAVVGFSNNDSGTCTDTYRIDRLDIYTLNNTW